MKKLILILIPFILQATEIDKIIYNGKEGSSDVSLNSDLKSGENLDISKIDELVSNFKYVKNNNIEIKIEPSNIEDKSNIVITNKKTNPFKLSLSFDNYGENSEEGKYRYNISTGLEGLILNEKLDITYTFVRPIQPNRKESKNIDELLPGEEIEEVKDKRKVRRNENLNINLSFPIKNNKIYLIYSNSKYLKSILTENDNIYDIYGVSDKYEIKIDKKLNKEINLITSYSYIDKKSYVEDVLSSRDEIHNISIGLNSKIKEDHKLLLRMDNKVANQKYIPSLTIDYEYKDIFNMINTIENRELNTILNLKLKYKNIYSNIGFDTNYKSFTPKATLGLNFDISKLNVDMSLEYNKIFKILFALKLDVVK